MLTDPIGKEFTGGITKLDYLNRLELYKQEYSRPFSEKWIELAIIEKESNSYIGYCGMQYIESEQEYEFFYGLLRDSWGKGYGYEATYKFLIYLFQTFSHSRYFAIVEKQNLASKKLLSKLGFSLSKQIIDKYNQELDYFLITKDTIIK